MKIKLEYDKKTGRARVTEFEGTEKELISFENRNFLVREDANSGGKGE